MGLRLGHKRDLKMDLEKDQGSGLWLGLTRGQEMDGR